VPIALPSRAENDRPHEVGGAFVGSASRAERSSTQGNSPPLRALFGALKAAFGAQKESRHLDAWGKDAELSRALRPLGEWLFEHYWRVRVEGAENVPTGACVLVGNHGGALPLDGPMVHLALKRQRAALKEVRWLLEDQLLQTPLYGALFRRLGAVRPTPDNALALLEAGHPLLVFPEGFPAVTKAFAERYQLRRFGRGGYLKIAAGARVPIIPVAIVGAEESVPLIARLPTWPLGFEYFPLTLPPLPARWHIRFGQPIQLSPMPTEPSEWATWTNASNATVKHRVEAMLQDLLNARKRVF
jgi:1-acyl-sn-glycerol-3-phosphate acyltransferase